MARWGRAAALGTAGLVLVSAVTVFFAWLGFGTSNADPESATGRRRVDVVRAERYMVVAAHPLAARAGQEILAAGGGAVDAAVAVQAMLTLVEPQSSGIGGGAFLLHYDAGREKLEAFDGREVAPAAASAQLFVHEDGDPYGFIEALVGGRSVGVPGVLRMLEKAHAEHGQRPWKDLFQPAIRTARSGFQVTPRLHALLRRDPLFRALPAARALYYDQRGRAKPVGSIHRNPELAAVLERVANEGADAFYVGDIADAMVAAVQGAVQPATWLAAANFALLRAGLPFGVGGFGVSGLADVPAPGFLAPSDLAEYRPRVREPVCVDYRAYRVCGHPPPTSGGVTTLQIIGMLAHHDLTQLKPTSVQFAHLIVEAGRLAFADRSAYLGDPDFVEVPVEALLDPSYLAERAKLIDPGRAADRVRPGRLGDRARLERTPDTTPSLPSTSHFSVVDADGNVVSMTTSVENVFGSRVVVRGFILNNQLTDFAFVPEQDGRPVANAVAPGKRPRSSMSPLVIFERSSGRPVLALGSPGGSRIIGYTAQATLAVLAFSLDPAQAAALPHILGRSGPAELENSGWPEGRLAEVRSGLEALGHDVQVGPMNSGIHVIRMGEGVLEGGVDPRREGLALGEESLPSELSRDRSNRAARIPSDDARHRAEGGDSR